MIPPPPLHKIGINLLTNPGKDIRCYITYITKWGCYKDLKDSHIYIN